MLQNHLMNNEVKVKNISLKESFKMSKWRNSIKIKDILDDRTDDEIELEMTDSVKINL